MMNYQTYCEKSASISSSLDSIPEILDEGLHERKRKPIKIQHTAIIYRIRRLQSSDGQ
jgi:hypothetical protein